MPYLYRIVDEDGLGMYSSSYDKLSLLSRADLRSAMVDNIRHPPPEEDGGIGAFWTSLRWDKVHDWLFAFSSIEQLRNWVYAPEWLEALHKSGGKLLVITYTENDLIAQNVVLGWTQAVFHRDMLCDHNVTSISLLDVMGIIPKDC